MYTNTKTRTLNPYIHALYDYGADKPIPNNEKNTNGWRDRKDIYVEECGERLVRITPNLQDVGIKVEPAYFNMGVPGAEPDCYLREGVLRELIPIGQILKNAGTYLRGLDFQRPPVTQGALFFAFKALLADRCGMTAEALQKAQRAVPDGPEYGKRFQLSDLAEAKKCVVLPPLSLEEIQSVKDQGLLQYVQKYVSLPDLNARLGAPHFCGAADVDVWGLNMGVFDDFTARSNMRYFEIKAANEALTEEELEILLSRRIFATLVSMSGSLVYLPSESWHVGLSDGDPLSVACSGKTGRAKYGMMFPWQWADRPWAKSLRFSQSVRFSS